MGIRAEVPMTDPILRRRVPRKLFATAWTGASALTTEVPDHAGLAQHQLSIACTGVPASAIATVWVRPIGSGAFVSVGTIDLSINGTGRLLFSGIFDAVRVTVTPAFSGITAAVQLDSHNDNFLPEGPTGPVGPTGPTGPAGGTVFYNETLVSSSYYHVAGVLANGSSTNSGAPGTNLMWLVPFTVSRNCVVTQLGFYNSTLASQTACAIYADNNGTPGALLVSQTPVASPSAGSNIGSVTSTTLIAGTTYWAAIGTSGTGNVACVSAGMMRTLGAVPGSNLVNIGLQVSLTSGWSVLPSTLVAATFLYASPSYFPMIYFNG
jgi:hypothetical protein